MEELREGVFLRAQGQKDPLLEHKNEGYLLFDDLMNSINRQTTGHLVHLATGLESYREDRKIANEGRTTRLG